MKIYYINLDKSEDRRKHMEELFSKLGWKAERFPAKTKKDIDNKFFKNKFNFFDLFEKRDKQLERACATSHLKLYEQALREGHDIVAVLEDDVCTDLSPEKLNDKISSFLKNHPNFDMVKFGKTNELCSKLALTGDNDDYNVHRPVRSVGSLAYIISRKGMEKMVRHKHTQPIDLEMRILKDVYQFHPNLFYECGGKFASTLDGTIRECNKTGCAKENFLTEVKYNYFCHPEVVVAFVLIIFLIIVIIVYKFKK